MIYFSVKQLNELQRSTRDIQQDIKGKLSQLVDQSLISVTTVKVEDHGKHGKSDTGTSTSLVELVKHLNITASNGQMANENLKDLLTEVHKLREENRMQLNELKKLKVEFIEETRGMRDELSGLRTELRDMSQTFAVALGTSLSESHYSFFENRFPSILKKAFSDALNEHANEQSSVVSDLEVIRE